ncbi:MAG: protein kinase [Candidatus Manganitrophus sp.]|nr:protein kinase [Candidatus Manganitrophus sp.]WDT71784.1 MAG: protein kinase [Candidatus Manganitrophus sp.]WDT80840.1 MAG: protein kinase [Candidatus Manganitrophus sp.]
MNFPAQYGKYLLIDKIAKGGMAEVFLAKQTGSKGFERLLAIKRILPQFTENAEFVSMFINEAKVAAQLSHPNIVQVFDFGQVEESYYIGMEYVMGRDLRTIMERSQKSNRPLPIDQILFIVSRVCSGLEHAHKKKDLHGNELNLVHRDISPQNILISYDGEIKLVDFGIAKAALQENETRTGILKGKLAYMSPEQAWGKGIDHRSDLFSLGIVLYECATGKRLFKGDSEINTLERVREAKFESPRQLNGAISEQVEAAVAKSLAKEVQDRYASAAQMQGELERCLSKPLSEVQSDLAQSVHQLFHEEIEKDQARMKKAALATAESVTVQLGIGTPASNPSKAVPSNPKLEIPKKRVGAMAITAFLIVGALGLIGVGTVVFLKKGEEPDLLVAKPLPVPSQPAVISPPPAPAAPAPKGVEVKPDVPNEHPAVASTPRTEATIPAPAALTHRPAEEKAAEQVRVSKKAPEPPVTGTDLAQKISPPEPKKSAPPPMERKELLPPPQEVVPKEIPPKQEPVKEAALRPPAAVTPKPPTLSDEELIRQIIRRQEKAFENKDVGLYLKDLAQSSPKDEKELQSFFDQYESISVQFDISDLQINGNRASITMNQQTNLRAKKAKKVQTATNKVSWGLLKEGEIWKISDTKIVEKK